MIYETLINIPNMYLVALGKLQSKQTEKKISLDLERTEGEENVLKRQPCNWWLGHRLSVQGWGTWGPGGETSMGQRMDDKVKHTEKGVPVVDGDKERKEQSIMSRAH